MAHTDFRMDNEVEGHGMFRHPQGWLPRFSLSKKKIKNDLLRGSKSLSNVFTTPEKVNETDLQTGVDNNKDLKSSKLTNDKESFTYFDPLVVQRSQRVALMRSKNLAVGTMRNVLCQYFDYEYNDLTPETQEDDTIYCFILPPDKWRKVSEYPSDEEFKIWMWIALHIFVPGTYDFDETEWELPSIDEYWKIFYDPWPKLQKEMEEKELTAEEMQQAVRAMYWLKQEYADPKQPYPKDPMPIDQLVKVLEKRVREGDTPPEKSKGRKDSEDEKKKAQKKAEELEKEEEKKAPVNKKKLFWPNYIPHGQALQYLSTPSRFHYMESEYLKFRDGELHPKVMQLAKLGPQKTDKGNLSSRWDEARKEDKDKDFGFSSHFVPIKRFHEDKNLRPQAMRQDIYIDPEGKVNTDFKGYKEEHGRDPIQPIDKKGRDVDTKRSSLGPSDSNSDSEDSDPFGQSHTTLPKYQDLPFNDILYYTNAPRETRKKFIRSGKAANPSSKMAYAARLAQKLYTDEQKDIRTSFAVKHGITVPKRESEDSESDEDFIAGRPHETRQKSPEAEKPEEKPRKRSLKKKVSAPPEETSSSNSLSYSNSGSSSSRKCCCCCKCSSVSGSSNSREKLRTRGRSPRRSKGRKNLKGSGESKPKTKSPFSKPKKKVSIKLKGPSRRRKSATPQKVDEATDTVMDGMVLKIGEKVMPAISRTELANIEPAELEKFYALLQSMDPEAGDRIIPKKEIIKSATSMKTTKAVKSLFDWQPYMSQIKLKKGSKTGDRKWKGPSTMTVRDHRKHPGTKEEMENAKGFSRGDAAPNTSQKDFLFLNAQRVAMSAPKRRPPAYVDDRYGTRHDFCSSGLNTHFVYGKEFGKVPEYLQDRNESLGKPRIPDFRNLYRAQVCKYFFGHYHCQDCRKVHPVSKYGKGCRDCTKFDPLA